MTIRGGVFAKSDVTTRKPSPVAPEDINNIGIIGTTAETLNVNIFLWKLFVYGFCCLVCTDRWLKNVFKEGGLAKKW